MKSKVRDIRVGQGGSLNGRLLQSPHFLPVRAKAAWIL